MDEDNRMNNTPENEARRQNRGNREEQKKEELEEQFGSRCGPQIYQIQRNLASVKKGADNVTIYYGKLKRFWDELSILLPMPRFTSKQCVCDVSRRLNEVESTTKLSQFLMGLNKIYENVSGYILNTDLLPSVNKALSMITTVERQQEETCFKLNGYPEWFIELREKKKQQQLPQVSGSQKSNIVSVNSVAETPFDDREDQNVTGEFACNALFQLSDEDEWIIDTGASSHMCYVESTMFNLKKLNNALTVHLPNGEKTEVVKKGMLKLSDDLILEDVLYIPTFRYNLLSVNKLSRYNGVVVNFNHDSCMIQDLKTKAILAIGGVEENLYVLKAVKRNEYDDAIEDNTIPVADTNTTDDIIDDDRHIHRTDALVDGVDWKSSQTTRMDV
ncbi:Retrovirus-related Pol polyprotein from transposon TNT 1-94 [Senna tora]|uniref:Retrovirus-related Pol polyprotein from transposon TNT 1-94 n=1 Tax=Senna tora TaxID=362788 RepID=A0A834X8B9_9FABA|nr:Retrovirus-related Pol polyprotein from transposon TNT 1-94 [Senna tora]